DFRVLLPRLHLALVASHDPAPCYNVWSVFTSSFDLIRRLHEDSSAGGLLQLLIAQLGAPLLLLLTQSRGNAGRLFLPILVTHDRTSQVFVSAWNGKVVELEDARGAGRLRG